jgi:putative membrane protein insertion efficiency factor
VSTLVTPGAEAGTTSELTPEPTLRPGFAARRLIGLVRVYQSVRRGRPSPCRYLPSCSEYAAIALDRHGAARGGWLTVRRLCRCHPWGGYGADPVPERPGVRNPS